MKGILKPLMILLLLTTLVSCVAFTPPDDIPPPCTGDECDIEDEIIEVDNYPELYQDLFNLDNQISFVIDIDPIELRKINDDYRVYSERGMKSDIYRYANSVTFIINDEEYMIPHVGIRMKGNTSRQEFINGNNEMYTLVHFRMSFQQTFDSTARDPDGNYKYPEPMVWTQEQAAALKNRKVFGLDKLEMKYNKERDLTYSREIYTSLLFRQFGIKQQLMGNTILKIKNSTAEGSLGIYRFAEIYDEGFIERNFPLNQQDGDLYKAGWGSCGGADFNSRDSYCYGNGDTGYSLTYELDTNKKTSSHAAFSRLLSFLDESDSYVAKNLDKYIDVNSFITLQALYFLIGDPDSMRYNNNNFFIYFTQQGIAHFFPYDFDRTFGAKSTWNPLSSGVYLDPLSFMDCNGNYINNKLIRKTIESNTELRNKYLSRINEIANDSFYSFSSFRNVYNKIYANYRYDTEVSYQNLRGNMSFQLHETGDIEGQDSNYSVEKYFNNKRLS